MAEACQAVGWRELAKALKENGEVEIKDAYCCGNCALGPSAMVNGTLIGRATAETLLSAIESGATA